MGKVQGGMICVKYLLFFFNFIFWLSGCAVTGMGLWLRFDPDTNALLKDEAPLTYFIASYSLIVIGGIIMLVGFFGCCGAMRESQCLLGLFFFSLVIIFGAEVAAGVLGYVNKDSVVGEIQGFYLNSLNDNNGNGTIITSMYHSTLKCCGSDSTSEVEKEKLCEDPIGSKNCIEAISEFFNEKLYIIAYMGVGIAGVVILGMIFSMVLCCAIRNSRDVI